MEAYYLLSWSRVEKKAEGVTQSVRVWGSFPKKVRIKKKRGALTITRRNRADGGLWKNSA